MQRCNALPRCNAPSCPYYTYPRVQIAHCPSSFPLVSSSSPSFESLNSLSRRALLGVLAPSPKRLPPQIIVFEEIRGCLDSCNIRERTLGLIAKCRSSFSNSGNRDSPSSRTEVIESRSMLWKCEDINCAIIGPAIPLFRLSKITRCIVEKICRTSSALNATHNSTSTFLRALTPA